MGSKRHIITNWEPYFVMYSQITLVLQRNSSVLVNKNCTFYVIELSIGITVTGFPFDQMEPSRSMQHRSGNLVRIPKLERDFLDFWIEFYAGFYEWVNERLITNDYKQYFASSGVCFGLLFQTYFNPKRAALFGPISQPEGGGQILPPKISETNWRNIKCVVLVDGYDPPESIGTKKSTNIPCMTPQWHHK